MKTLLLVLGFSVFLIHSSFAEEYQLKWHSSKEKIIFEVETVDLCPSLGALVLSSLFIELPDGDQPGKIELVVTHDKEGFSATAFGKRRGYFTFIRGERLPYVKDGLYEVWINGSFFGQYQVAPSCEREGVYP